MEFSKWPAARGGSRFWQIAATHALISRYPDHAVRAGTSGRWISDVKPKCRSHMGRQITPGELPGRRTPIRDRTAGSGRSPGRPCAATTPSCSRRAGSRQTSSTSLGVPCRLKPRPRLPNRRTSDCTRATPQWCTDRADRPHHASQHRDKTRHSQPAPKRLVLRKGTNCDWKDSTYWAWLPRGLMLQPLGTAWSKSATNARLSSMLLPK